MSTGFELTLFERFELSASLLLVHQRRLGVPSEIISRPLGPVDWRAQIQLSLRLVRDVANLGAWIQTIYDDRRREALRAENSRRARGLKNILVRVEELKSAMSKGEQGLEELLEAGSPGKEGFDRQGLLLCRSLERFRRSRGYGRLRRMSVRRSDRKKVREAADALIEDVVLRRRLRSLLLRILRLLRLLRHAETSLRTQPDRPILMLSMVYCYYRVRTLFVMIEDMRRYLPCESDLEDMLGFSARALRIEANRSLKQELRHLDLETEPERFDDRLERALSMLQNGFEQVFRQLFQSAGHGYATREILDAPRQSRLKESLHLVEDLQSLHHLAERMESEPSDDTRGAFQERLRVFKRRSLFSLYHRDRRTVDEFEGELAECRQDEIRFVAHRLGIYLSTLLAQVNNRNVLSFAAPAGPESKASS